MTFDWRPYIVERYPTHVDGADLVIRYVRGKFRLHRRASIRDVYWLLGLYQAEGSKKSRLDWSFPSTTIRLLVEAIRVLGRLGIPAERLYLQVLHDADDDPAEVRAVFEGWLDKLPWKYRCARYRVTPAMRRLCARITRLEPEMKTLRRFSPPERLGRTNLKGVPYPFEFDPYDDFA